MRLKFKVDPYWQRQGRKSNWLDRWAARRVAGMFLERPTDTWQVFGKEWSNFKNGQFVEPKTVESYLAHTQIAQIILRTAAYKVAEIDLMKICGDNPQGATCKKPLQVQPNPSRES